MTIFLPRPRVPLAVLRRLAARFASKRRAYDPLDDALCEELQSMRHAEQVLTLHKLRHDPHLARDIGLEPELDPCRPVPGPGGRLL